MFTIAAAYALYFPLILYLSANFSFVWALLIALVVPGVLLANYARWLLGGNLGFIGAVVFPSARPGRHAARRGQVDS